LETRSFSNKTNLPPVWTITDHTQGTFGNVLVTI
jgi:hypothetical protein